MQKFNMNNRIFSMALTNAHDKRKVYAWLFRLLSKFEDEEKPKIFYEFFQADAKHTANNKLPATKKKTVHVKQMFGYGIMEVDKNSIIAENKV